MFLNIEKTGHFPVFFFMLFQIGYVVMFQSLADIIERKYRQIVELSEFDQI
jgi:hypothetical protein